jgi:Flp pilus assembly pilin Flp
MCTRGQGLIEYSLILCLIALSLISVLLLLRNSTGTTYTGVRGNLDQVVACDGSASCANGGTESGASASGGTSGGGNGNKGNGYGNWNNGNGNGNNGNGNGNGRGNGSNGKGGGK